MAGGSSSQRVGGKRAPQRRGSSCQTPGAAETAQGLNQRAEATWFLFQTIASAAVRLTGRRRCPPRVLRELLRGGESTTDRDSRRSADAAGTSGPVPSVHRPVGSVHPFHR